MEVEAAAEAVGVIVRVAEDGVHTALVHTALVPTVIVNLRGLAGAPVVITTRRLHRVSPGHQVADHPVATIHPRHQGSPARQAHINLAIRPQIRVFLDTVLATHLRLQACQDQDQEILTTRHLKQDYLDQGLAIVGDQGQVMDGDQGQVIHLDQEKATIHHHQTRCPDRDQTPAIHHLVILDLDFHQERIIILLHRPEITCIRTLLRLVLDQLMITMYIIHRIIPIIILPLIIQPPNTFMLLSTEILEAVIVIC